MHHHAQHPTYAQRAFFALLYFSEGAPIGYIWWAMPTRLRDAGMPVDKAAALIALLTLPWALKFLWAPAIDRLRSRRWNYRAWITLTQALMGLTLLPLAILPVTDLTNIIALLLIAHAVAAATQDVAIDALAIATIPHDARGRVTGWMQAGTLLGRAIFGGLALTAEQWIGPRPVVVILILCIWITLAAVWLVPLRQLNAIDPPRPNRPFFKTLAAALASRAVWIGLAIALIAGAGFEAVGVLVGPYLRDHAVNKETVGLFLAGPVVACMILGSLLGGWAADKLGHRKLAMISVAAIAISVYILVAADAALGARGYTLLAAILPIYIFIGSLTASTYALFMDISDPEIGGTQFSAFMGATNLCEVWAVALAGVIVARFDYAHAFLALAIISLFAIPLIPFAARNPKLPQ